jgi:type IV secretion system protein TrbL
MKKNSLFTLLALTLLLYSMEASAVSNTILNDVIDAFKDKASSWETTIKDEASYLFWTLATIRVTWEMGQLALKKADIQEFFAELLRISITLGLFWWLLTNATSGLNIAGSIISSLQKLGNNAAGIEGLSPSDLVQMGLVLFGASLVNASMNIASIVGIGMSIAILVILSSIAINMAILLISEWFLLYAGVFFLGFGGSSWTSDMAINYYKTVLGIGIQLFAMTLIAGVGIDLLSTYFAQLAEANKAGVVMSGDEMAIALVFCIMLWKLSEKLPPLLAGIINGSGIGSNGSVSADTVAGAAMAGAAMAGAAMAAGASGMLSAGANVAGLKDAYNAASEGGVMDGNFRDGGSSMMNTAGTSPKQNGGTALASAMGDNDTGSRQSSTGNQSSSMGSRLASGIKSAAQSKAGEIKQNLADKVNQTAGGQVASAIRAADSAYISSVPGSDENSLSAGIDQAADLESPSKPDPSEFEEFINRTKP